MNPTWPTNKEKSTGASSASYIWPVTKVTNVTRIPESYIIVWSWTLTLVLDFKWYLPCTKQIWCFHQPHPSWTLKRAALCLYPKKHRGLPLGILYELLPTVTRAPFWTWTLTAYFYYTMFTNHIKIYIKIFLDKPTCTLPNVQPQQAQSNWLSKFS